MKMDNDQSFWHAWGRPIATGVVVTMVVGMLSWLLLTFGPRDPWAALAAFLVNVYIPNGVILLSVILLCGAAFFAWRYKSRTMTSAQWFDEIVERLSNCGYARVYLRSFDHPDDFREEHRRR